MTIILGFSIAAALTASYFYGKSVERTRIRRWLRILLYDDQELPLHMLENAISVCQHYDVENEPDEESHS